MDDQNINTGILNNHAPLDHSPGILGGSITGTDRDAIEVPLIHRIVENWGRLATPLPTMVGWLREYGRTYFVMESQNLLRERDGWREKAELLLQQAETARSEKIQELEKKIEAQHQNNVTQQKAEFELRELLRLVVHGNKQAFERAAEIVGFDKQQSFPLTYRHLSCHEELLKKALQLKDIELQEARHKIKRMQGTKPISTWEANYRTCLAELNEARGKINQMQLEFNDVVKADMAGVPRPIQTAVDYHHLWKDQVDVNHQHVLDYNILGEKLRNMEDVASKWATKYNTLDSQVDTLGNRLMQIFPDYIKVSKTKEGENRYDIDDAQLERDWILFQAVHKRSQVQMGIGMLSESLVAPGIGKKGFAKTWSAESMPSNTDYRDLYHKTNTELFNIRLALGQKVDENGRYKMVYERALESCKNYEKAIAINTKTIHELKQQLAGRDLEGWMAPSAAKNLKDQAKMWKQRYQKLSEEGTVESFANAPVGAYVSLIDYKARVQEINALHHKMQDVYRIIRKYIPSDRNQLNVEFE